MWWFTVSNSCRVGILCDITRYTPTPIAVDRGFMLGLLLDGILVGVKKKVVKKKRGPRLAV